MAAKNRSNGAQKPQSGANGATRGESHKEKAIALAVSTIEKQFGKGAILTMTNDAINREVQSFSSGSARLDLALGI